MSSKSASADELLNSLVTYICIVSPSLVHVCAMQSTDFLTTERDGPQYQGMLARSRGSMGQTQPGPFKNDWGPMFPCSTARESDVSKCFNCMALESDFFFLICRRTRPKYADDDRVHGNGPYGKIQKIQ